MSSSSICQNKKYLVIQQVIKIIIFVFIMDVCHANIDMKPIHRVGGYSQDVYSRWPLSISFIPSACPSPKNIQFFHLHHGRSFFYFLCWNHWGILGQRGNRGDQSTMGTGYHGHLAVWPDLYIIIDWGATWWIIMDQKITTYIGGVMWPLFIILNLEIVYFELT